jgi:hypothetical protein
MMDLTPYVRAYGRMRQARLATLNPIKSQARTLKRLVARAADTTFGKDYRFASVKTVEDFQARVPLRKYEDFWRDYWQKRYPVVENVTWPGRVPFFALTSGTSSGTTKYIPVTHAMRRSNTRAAMDVLVNHLKAKPKSHILQGKSFMLGGSTALTKEAPGVFAGDLSGIATKTLPRWIAGHAFPDSKLALMSDWEKKVALLAERALDEDIRVLTGTPSWVLILLDRIRQLREARGDGDKPVLPHLELFIHGGVNFAPYRPRFLELFAGLDVDMREVYPASEGFLASADRGWGDGLRLNVDHGLFFEFVPVEDLDQPSPRRHWLKTVEPNINYAVVLSSCAGVWSYVIGDTVRFVDLKPPRILVTGRTSYGLSAFGEHLIAEEIENAIASAAALIGSSVTDYSVGALYPEETGTRGGHLYVVEFASEFPNPAALSRFADTVDKELSRLNDDYKAHRADGFGMDPPRIQAVPAGTFAEWMKSRNKMGGQHKVARVINDPELWSNLLSFTKYH